MGGGKKPWGQATRVGIWKDVKSGSWESSAGATANLHLKRVCWLEVACRPANIALRCGKQ